MDEKARENNRLRQRKFLELHKDEVNEKRREKYHERLDRGKCPRCGGKAKKGRTLCDDCGEYMLKLNRKYAKQSRTSAAKPRAAKKTKAATKARAATKVKTATRARAKAAPKAKAKAKTRAPAKRTRK